MQEKEFTIEISSCASALSNSVASVDQAYAQAMTVTVPLSQTFGFTTSDSANCAFTTIKVFDSSGSTELYSGDFASGTYTFPSSSRGSTAYQIQAYESGGSFVSGTLNIIICGDETV